MPFTTNSGTKEFLWAELRKLGATDMEVLYMTPPVSHAGPLDRIRTHPLSDLVDGLIVGTNGQHLGGYTMRVMFRRGREQWGRLPLELETEEKKCGADEA